MGLVDFLRSLFRSPVRQYEYPEKYDTEELARRLDVPAAGLQFLSLDYREFTIPKQNGEKRTITAPSDSLKKMQRTILRRILGRLRSHPNVTGFERGHSIVTNALPHAGCEVVIRMDIKGFFANTTGKRIHRFFRFVGWDEKAAGILTTLCTYRNALPQGAPTSPRLSNLVNYPMDLRLRAMADSVGAAYSRYADDLTFSFNPRNAEHHSTAGELAERGNDLHWQTTAIIRSTKKILGDYGYKLHTKSKLHIRRRHQQQLVTGLVVNEKPALPRRTRRWLRAVGHHLSTGRQASLTPEQLAGWHSLRRMIDNVTV